MRVALVVGGSANVWEEVEAALALGDFHGAVGCNDVGAIWPGRLDAHVSLHADHHRLWAAQREARGLPPHKRVLVVTGAAQSEPRLSPAVTGETDYRFPGQTASGSSGLFALKVALIDLRFDRAVLCGIPMSGGAGHIARPGQPWAAAEAHQPGWIQALPQIKGRVRSMSGWTRDRLGIADAAFVNGD